MVAATDGGHIVRWHRVKQWWVWCVADRAGCDGLVGGGGLVSSGLVSLLTSSGTSFWIVASALLGASGFEPNDIDDLGSHWFTLLGVSDFGLTALWSRSVWWWVSEFSVSSF